MRWEDLRNAAPQQWVIIEAVDAHTEGDNRVIENIQLAEVFGQDNIGVLRCYAQLHKSHPEREFYVFHTSRPELNVKERKWTGIRALEKMFEMSDQNNLSKLKEELDKPVRRTHKDIEEAMSIVGIFDSLPAAHS